MYFIIYLTEDCNLECSYCETRDSRGQRLQEIRYPLPRLIEFLAEDPQLNLQLYGGEPLLRIDLIDTLLSSVDSKHTCIQTNGLMLDQLPDHLLSAIDVFCVSLDGPPAVTNACRGDGVYERALAQVRGIRERGYTGRVDVRMTVSPGLSILDSVNHFVDETDGLFDGIHWQLNVLFGVEEWRFDHKFITRWLTKQYNPQITELVTRWVEELRAGRLVQIIPFVGLMHDLISGRRTDHVRCGAGVHAWTIVPSGDVYPCPVLRASADYRVGNLESLSLAQIQPTPGLRGPCANCKQLSLCGGRCIYASEAMRWGEKGFNLVCGSVKHLIRELERVTPTVRELMADAGVTLDSFDDLSFDYEVIP